MAEKTFFVASAVQVKVLKIHLKIDYEIKEDSPSKNAQSKHKKARINCVYFSQYKFKSEQLRKTALKNPGEFAKAIFSFEVEK